MQASSWKVTLAAILLIGLFVVACGAQTPAPPVKETVPVPQTVIVPQTVVVEKVVEKTVVAPPAVQPTAAPAATTAPKAEPPTAVLSIVPVAANAQDPNVFTATVKYITDTVVGPATVVQNLGDAGLTNHPVGVPVHVSVAPANPKDQVSKIAWTLTAPKDSKAAIKDPAAATTEFTPDIVGMYKVDATITNDAGSGSDTVQIHAGTYAGNDATTCKQCHANKVEEWAKTGHAVILSDNIDNKRTPDVPTHYAEGCVRCHSVGYYPDPYTGSGGYAEAAAKANYQLPTFKQINAGGNWAKMPADVKAMANIQCENCHGPAKEHVTTGANVMAVSFDNGACNVCHAGGGHHIKGIEITFSAHSDSTAAAWNEPTGPGEQACVRCHSGKGYASFLQNPTNQAAWDNSKQTVGCATCHDPHSEANVFQLRVVGKPVGLPFDAKDAGLSATCEECHNSRVSPANAVKGSFPHYSSAAELLNNTGGVDYGKKVPDSPHGLMVGNQPIANPAAKDDPEAAKWLFTGAQAKAGNVPGPCVTCHMAGGVTDAKDPNYMKVGEHSFNTTSPDGKFENTAACKTCHGDVKDFDLPAKADYDGNGKTEGVQEEVAGLLNVLWKALQDKGLKKVDTGYPYATLPKDSSGNIDPKIANAWYNFRTVYGVMWGTDTGNGNQGKGAAIHNFQRSVALLQLAYKDLTGQDVPNATILVK